RRLGERDRHAVVDRRDQLVRRGRDDGARAHARRVVTFGAVVPDLPEPGKGERLTIAPPKEPRLLRAPTLDGLPLVEAVGGHDAPAPLECTLERVARRELLAACVDQAIADREVLGP